MENYAGYLISSAQTRSGLSLRELGRRAGTSHATLHAYIRGTKSPSMTTLTRILNGCDFALDFSLRRRVRERGGLDRGEELVAVLRLAAQFPVHGRKRSEDEQSHPIFPRD